MIRRKYNSMDFIVTILLYLTYLSLDFNNLFIAKFIKKNKMADSIQHSINIRSIYPANLL